MARTIRLRPHHLLCLPRFRGEGYSPEFIEKAKEISELLQEPDTTLILVDGPDDLCEKCPVMQECTYGEVHKLARDLDSIVLDAIGLKLHEEIKAKMALSRTAKAIPSVEMVCTGCQWLDTCLEVEKGWKK